MRDFFFKAAVVVVFAALVALAWLTRNPDAEILERATHLPVVGRWAESFRRSYLPPERVPEEADSDSEPEVVFIDGPGRASETPDELLGARPVVWVKEDTPLLSEPETDAEIVARTAGIANLRVFERRGDWFDVSYRRSRGWVYLEEYEESSEPPLGSEPLPPGPLPARSPDTERLEFARELLGPGDVATELGPYVAYADTARPPLWAFLDRVVGPLESVYRRRYGVDPVGEPGGAIVLFGRHDDFAAYRDRELRMPGVTAAGVAAGGIVALDLERRRNQEIAATLVHELTHLLNRRALGPALPAWLDEGLADDLAQSEIDPDGTLVTEHLGGVSIRRWDGWEWRGALASSLALRRALEEGRLRPLSELMSLDWRDFVAQEPEQPNYAQASFWLRFLLEERTSREALHAYLSGVAQGRSAEGEELRRLLGRSWAGLDADFAAWIRVRFHQPE